MDRRRVGIVLAALAAVALAAGAPSAPATSAGSRLPLLIASAGLSQRGAQLVWRVSLGQPFSPGALARDGRTLCLLIERPRDGAVSASVCLTGPARGARAPRLAYARVSASGAGPSRIIPAQVSRSSSRELTAAFLPGDVGLRYAPLRWQVISTLSVHACASPRPGERRCFLLYPSAPRLLALHAPAPAGCRVSGPLWVFHGPTDRREIALTFDDGPWSDTAAFLNVLEREHVVATFFQIGEQIARYGALDRRMLADGDMIGDHTWNYGGNVAAGGVDAAVQIKEAAAAIRKATGGFQPCLFRAPGGNVTPSLLRTARSLGFSTIQWDVDPRDWTRPGAAAIYERVIAGARDGAIVIQHDGGGDRSQTLAALPREIEALRRQGYRFVTVTQMLGYPLVYR